MRKNKQKGFITLVSTLIIMTVVLFVVRGISLQAIDDAETGSAVEQYNIAKYLAEACAEYALLEIRNDPSYTTATTVSTGFDNGNECEVVSISGDTVLRVRSIVGDNLYNYLAEITMSTTTATTSPSIVVDTWEEVNSF